MTKLERDMLKSVAKQQNTGKRTKVVLPDLPKLRPLAKDQDQAWKDDWAEWNRQVAERKVDALYELAEERSADVNELAKVIDLVLEVVPPDSRGKKGVDPDKIQLTAMYIGQGKSQKTSCELAGIDTKTLRTYQEENPLNWKIYQHGAIKIPDEEIRKMLKGRPLEE